MKVFFIGSVDFSRKLLNTLLKIPDCTIVGIATKSRSFFNADHTDLSDIAIKAGIPYKYVKDINAPHIIKWIISLQPDVIFCFGWSALISEELLKLSPKGVIGYHPAKLPQNRGRHPIIWALALGLDSTASTFFKMDEGADSGDIINQQEVVIEHVDNARSLYLKLVHTAQQQVFHWIPELAQNNLVTQVQDHKKANYWRKRGKKDGAIDFRMCSESIYNLVRALTSPYVGAHVNLSSEEYKVWSCSVGPKVAKNIEPGKILSLDEKKIQVKTADGSVFLMNHEINTPLKVGDHFE